MPDKDRNNNRYLIALWPVNGRRGTSVPKRLIYLKCAVLIREHHRFWCRQKRECESRTSRFEIGFSYWRRRKARTSWLLFAVLEQKPPHMQIFLHAADPGGGADSGTENCSQIDADSVGTFKGVGYFSYTILMKHEPGITMSLKSRKERRPEWKTRTAAPRKTNIPNSYSQQQIRRARDSAIPGVRFNGWEWNMPASSRQGPWNSVF
ncbi:hypothetical protein H6P81_005265 [Aristolochia fimbriata]|uniref:Uncharacterized protein n=1 Tax=Aristolochia fimbriata TaxID=158543 RepID=A0AAV7EV43_ARIFI|nr:hypothetical protein H6P81_005265 [Aristolochia fimbriata]